MDIVILVWKFIGFCGGVFITFLALHLVILMLWDKVSDKWREKVGPK